MSYRPKYNDSDNNKVDLPIDAETLAGHAVESSGVDSNTSTLPTTAQVKAYVDYLTNINAERITALEGAMPTKVDKSDIGYIELDDSSSSGTLTDAQFAEVLKPYCIIHWANVWFYKSKTITVVTSSYYFRAYTDVSGSTNIAFQEVYMTVLSNKNWTYHSGTYNIYSKDKTDELLNAKANISDIPHLYEHHIVIADNSDLSLAQNYATFTITSTNATELNTSYKIANALIDKGITSASVALRASGRCSEMSFNFVEEVMFDESDVNLGTCTSSIVGVYGYDDDPALLKIVYTNFDANQVHSGIRTKTASTTYVHDTVVQLF